MWLTVHNIKSTELDNKIINAILSIYPEERLIERDVFKNAFNSNSIEFKDLKEESEKCLIPWQFFLLSKENLKNELKHIEGQRADKVSSKLLAKRKGIGDTTSKRIIDRLIRLQNYICSHAKIGKNKFCGSLTGKSNAEAVHHIVSFFEIDLNDFRRKNKTSALNYLIEKIEDKNINISQGVLTNKILPTYKVVDSNIYKNTSGFVIKDDCLPFVFLPSEVNPDESEGRHIYTLIYLVVLIGLGEYEFFLDKKFMAKILTAKGQSAKVHSITSEMLLPSTITDGLCDKTISKSLRDELASTYKITPTAVVVILRIRGIISAEEYKKLLPDTHIPNQDKKRFFGRPYIDTSVRKFCGKYSCEIINEGIRSGSTSAIQAQYLFFGSVNKKGYKEYCERLSI